MVFNQYPVPGGYGDTMRNTIDLKEEILTLCAGFNTHFIERDEEIRGAILAILSNENILYLGPPGTAKTSLPCSAANFAVMSAPLFSPASMTTVARDKPEIMRFLGGKLMPSGLVPGG